jgi:hypothetical protein
MNMFIAGAVNYCQRYGKAGQIAINIASYLFSKGTQLYFFILPMHSMAI